MISIPQAGAGSAQKSTVTARASFSAFGRRFDLELEPNARLLTADESPAAGYSPYRGKLANVANSWVRLTHTPTGWTGAIWDGIELYSIAATRATEKFLDTPLSKPDVPTVIYRMSETDSGLTDQFCGVGDAQNVPRSSDIYRSLKRELRSQQALGTMPSESVSVYVVADAEFAAAISSDGGDPRGEMLARMNIVDGIFSDQVGVAVVASDLVVTDSAGPFTSTVPGTLLDQVSDYRTSTVSSRLRGITHLMTGKDLDGSTAGIAFRGGLCSTSQSVSLSEGWRDPTTSALIAAHEVGHNFGAPHDGEAGSTCASEPQTFLMAPTLNGSTTFSACSLAQMQPIIAAATCLEPVSGTPPMSSGDVSVAVASPNVSGVVQQAVSFPTITVAAQPSVDAVQLSVTFDTSVAIQDLVTDSGWCAAQTTGAITCDLGTISAGQPRHVGFAVLNSASGTVNATVRVYSPNDTDNTNNAAEAAIDTALPTSVYSAAGSRRHGGGSLDAWLIAALALLLYGQRRRA